MATQLRVSAAIDLPLLAILCHEARTDDRLSRRTRGKLGWGQQIRPDDPDYQWSRQLSPVYGINVVGINSVCLYKVGFAERVKVKLVCKLFIWPERCYRKNSRRHRLPGIVSFCSPFYRVSSSLDTL